MLARNRLAIRHLEAGIVQTLQEGYERADFNDLPNGEFILTHLIPPTLHIRLVE
jgi:hypothetical protein